MCSSLLRDFLKLTYAQLGKSYNGGFCSCVLHSCVCIAFYYHFLIQLRAKRSSPRLSPHLEAIFSYVMWQSFEHVRADPAKSLDIRPSSGAQLCTSIFTVLLKPIITRTPTKATVAADFIFDVGSHIHAVSSLGLFKGAQPFSQVVLLKFFLLLLTPDTLLKLSVVTNYVGFYCLKEVHQNSTLLYGALLYSKR